MSHSCVLRPDLFLKKNMTSFWFAVGCMWLLVTSVATAEEPAYLVQPGDVLQVAVWKEPDLQAELLVRPDGRVSFPLAGDVVVGGQSVEQIGTTIAERIKRYVPNPVVTVVMKSIGGNRIYVVGNVNRPGEFSFSKPLDVMQALSLANGANAYASLSDIRILRRENGKQIAIRFDYGDIEKGRSLEKNILLQSGDTVVVP